MKQSLTLIILLFLLNISSGQIVATGEYDPGLKLAYDNTTKKLTGYFEDHSGWDEETNSPRFSCVFYIEGEIEDNIFKIKTCFPEDKSEDIIYGTLEVMINRNIKINLPEEHGGCWNVRHFANEQCIFSLVREIAWTTIRFINTDKAYFYAEKAIDEKQESYLVKRDFVCIDKIEDDWAYCTFYGKTITKGWIRTADLNKI